MGTMTGVVELNFKFIHWSVGAEESWRILPKEGKDNCKSVTESGVAQDQNPSKLLNTEVRHIQPDILFSNLNLNRIINFISLGRFSRIEPVIYLMQ